MTQVTRYYVDANGRYIGGFADVEPPPGSIEVPYAPDDASQTWNGQGWNALVPAVPAFVTPLQARRALRQAGLLAAVEAAVAQADDDTQDAWQYALSIERSNPIIAALAAQLDMTDEQIDDLFRLAATL